MNVFKLASTVALLIVINSACSLAHYTLADVMRASPSIADHKPSPLVAPISGQFIYVKGDWYQIRLFSFEAKPGVSQHPTFQKFIKQYHQEDSVPKVGPETLFPTDYFAATPAMKEQGFNYLLSLRKVEDSDLIQKLNRANSRN